MMPDCAGREQVPACNDAAAAAARETDLLVVARVLGQNQLDDLVVFFREVKGRVGRVVVVVQAVL